MLIVPFLDMIWFLFTGSRTCRCEHGTHLMLAGCWYWFKVTKFARRGALRVGRGGYYFDVMRKGDKQVQPKSEVDASTVGKW